MPEVDLGMDELKFEYWYIIKHEGKGKAVAPVRKYPALRTCGRMEI
jgi:hypothetical protein